MARVQEKNGAVAASRPYNDFLDEQLREDPLFAVEYLNAAMEDDDPKMFFIALSNVARAFGMGKVAEHANLGRESLYKSLSGKRDPHFTSVESILDALGMKLKVERKERVA